MRLFYTGAAQHFASQPSPTISLGGFLSSTQVPSGVGNSLFPSVSQKDLRVLDSYTTLLALQNTTEEAVTNIKVYHEIVDDSLYEIEIGLVMPAIDNNGNPKFEIITSPQSLPIGISFKSTLGVDNAVSVETLAPKSCIGIWIKRVLKESAKEAFNGCDILYQNTLTPNASSTKFPFDLKIDYI